MRCKTYCRAWKNQPIELVQKANLAITLEPEDSKTLTAKGKLTKVGLIILTLGLFNLGSVMAQDTLSLQQAIDIATNNDPWLHGNQLNQAAMEAKSIAAGTMPDPKVSMSLANLPVDSWQLDQEPMTQVKIGISQMFPRGDELAIKQSQLRTDSEKFPLLRIDRKAKVTAQVSQHWLDTYLAQHTIKLIERDRSLFEQMVDVAKASYSSASGKTRQQDVIRAQLELIQLTDRLTIEQQKMETSSAQLSQWLHRYDVHNDLLLTDFDAQSSALLVSDQLPNVKLKQTNLLAEKALSNGAIAQLLRSHPLIRAIDVKQKVANKEVDLANQQFKPQWGVNASYGLRENAPNGMSRPDFFSIGVTFDLPLFSQNRQRKWVSASVAESEAVKTQKLLQLKSMIAEVQKELRIMESLSQRQRLYQDQLVAQTHEQAEAALTAYTNDDGDFAEVVRARITELNTRISAHEIAVGKLKSIARLNYYLTQSNHYQYGDQ